MIEETRTTFGFNKNNPEMWVLHRQLKRHKDSPCWSECAKCETGLLVVKRQESKAAYANDACTVCGQRYHYLDVDDIPKPTRKLRPI